MDITLKREDGCQRTYEVKAPWEEIAPRFDAVTRTLAGQVRLPGFRGGKAPVPMVRSQFKKAIREEVMDHLLQDSAKETLEKFSIRPVVEPYAGELSLEDMMARFEEGQSLVRTCSQKLNQVERRIEILAKEGGQITAKPFGADDLGDEPADEDEKKPAGDGGLPF